MKGQLSLIEEKPITVLMSLREEYFNAMVKGTKRFEYRTRYLKDRSSAYIYISKTKKSIVAKIEFGEPIIGNAREIALLAEKEEPGCYDSILEYLYNDVGYAIPVESITSIEELTLAELKERFPNFVVPQSYYILDKKPELFDFLESKLEKEIMQDKKIIEEYFDTISKTYDENNKKMYWKLSDDLLWNIIKKFIPKTKSFNFLELGCGTGEWANKILGEFPNSSCVLVDFSNEMLKETKQKLAKYDKRVEIIKVDIENLKINKKFDLVLNIYVLPFFDNTEKLISVVSNCLRTGGKSISVAENYYNGLALNFLVGNINSIKELTENRDGYLSKYVPKLHFDKMNDLVKLHFDNGLIPIFKCGFPVISLIGVGESLTENNNSISKILKENYNYIFELEQNYIEDESLCNRGKYICIVGEKKMKKISILKEVINGENRVILLPQDIDELVKKYEVYVESGAGKELGYSDDEYRRHGATIASKDECWEYSDFIIKYKAPIKEEYKYLNSKVKLGAIFHAEGNYNLLKELKNKKVTAYTYEFIETEDGFFPMAYPGGEIAGKMAIMYANFYQQKQYGGAGRALFSVRGSKKSKIAIIGYGNVGGAAIKLAADLGNEVYVFGSNINKLKKMSVYMGETIHCVESTNDNLLKFLPEMDAIIGAILISTYDTAPIITKEIFSKLKPGTVIIDVTCGYGSGYIPSIDKYTSLSEPVYISDNGIICCKIDNLPSAYPVSTTEAYSSNAKEWILKILDHELLGETNEDVSRGKIFDKGNIVHDVIKEHWSYYTNE